MLTLPLPAASLPVVLDTNVVLDWLVFRNPGCSPLASALARGEARWIATAAMRAELAHVLARGHLDAWQPSLPALWSQWDRYCVELPAPLAIGPARRLRCSDADDQKFIDLAVAGGARWLVSRDRAVLKLARRLLECGVEAVPPERWAMPAT